MTAPHRTAAAGFTMNTSPCLLLRASGTALAA